MPLTTTVIGSYPQPDYLRLPTWFNNPSHKATEYDDYIETKGKEECEQLIDRAIGEILTEQAKLGIDVVTDGEIRRDTYINHLCRHVRGIDFGHLTFRSCRDGAWKASLPTITAKLEVPDDVSWIAAEWRLAQQKTTKSVKVTVPGPLTIIGSMANSYYEDEKTLSEDLVAIVNKHIRCLAEAGCRHIQLDEPLMVREPQKALSYGIDHASLCFEGIGPEVTRIVHLCCGYPEYLDQTDYLKADPNVYHRIADKLDQAGFHEISLEDAHRHNDLSLFDRFKRSKVILGSVTIANSRVETVEEIRARLRKVLEHLPGSDHLVVAPDCGLGYLPRDILQRKLANMVEAAKSLP